MKGDPRKTQRSQTLITFSLLVVESSFLHRKIALSKRFGGSSERIRCE